MEKYTLNYLTKYEEAAILSMRVEELVNGKPRTIKDPGTNNPIEIAKIELAAKKLPISIIRKWLDGHEEKWNSSELIKIE